MSSMGSQKEPFKALVTWVLILIGDPIRHQTCVRVSQKSDRLKCIDLLVSLYIPPYSRNFDNDRHLTSANHLGKDH